MYESFYGLNETPFRLSADESLCFRHDSYENVSRCISRALDRGRGFILLTGVPGTGKTTLCRDIISQVDREKVVAVSLLTSQLQAEELLRKLALELGLAAEQYDREMLLSSIQRHLVEQYQAGRRTIIFFDEAQNLTASGLHELEVLVNLQHASNPVVQIVLVGHNDLRDALAERGMQSIRQHLVASCEIENMSADQTTRYIVHRLNRAGWRDDPCIGEPLFVSIHEITRGIPRLINILMSRLLLFTATEEKHQVDEHDLTTVIRLLAEEDRLSLIDEQLPAFLEQNALSCSSTGATGHASGAKGVSDEYEDLNIMLDDLDISDTDWLGWGEYASSSAAARAEDKTAQPLHEGATATFKQAGNHSSVDSRAADSEHQWGGVWWMSGNVYGEVSSGLTANEELPAVKAEIYPGMLNNVDPVWIKAVGDGLGISGLRGSILALLAIVSIGLLIMFLVKYIV
ncbi:MAG: AAA family ATPase [gamma proteobacterium symbiont of Ctena orbiculata]